jgi:cytochrome P450
MDLVGDYAYPLPINVISDMLGVPPDRREDLRRWQAVGRGATCKSPLATHGLEGVT